MVGPFETLVRYWPDTEADTEADAEADAEPTWPLDDRRP